MAEYAVGSFPRATGTGAQAVTGVGFTPKALILWSANRTSDGLGDGFVSVFGITDGTFSVSLTTLSDDNVGTTEVQRSLQRTRLYHTVSNVGTLTARATLDSFDADGFSLDWDTNDGVASVINYLAIGGDASVKAGVFNSDTATGPQNITGVGFTPSAVLCWAAWTTATSETSNFNSFPNVSWMTSATTGGGAAITSEGGAAAANTTRYQRSTKAVLGVRSGISGNPGAVYFEADPVSFDADGFTVNWTTNTTPSVSVYYLALAGVDAVCGTFTTPAATGAQAITGLSITPSCVLALTVSATAHATPQSDSRFWLGASDGTTTRGAFWGDNDAADPTEAVGGTIDDRLIVCATPAATGASSTIDAAAALTSLDAGGFMLDWAAADATAREVLYLALGVTIDEPEPEPEPEGEGAQHPQPLIALATDDLVNFGTLVMTNEDALFPATNAQGNSPARLAKSTGSSTTLHSPRRVPPSWPWR
jgi:hypothetical protein